MVATLCKVKALSGEQPSPRLQFLPVDSHLFQPEGAARSDLNDRTPIELDFLNAQSDYRTVQLSYVNLLGSYLTAAAQLNMAVGREVIQ
jgi:outer membrane protein TolC